MGTKDIFNEDYYERGLETGISLYSNYRWIPELTFPLAVRLIKELHIQENHKIFDFGCAMGYLVKAFRLLGYNAWGYDISSYAIKNVPVDIKEYIWKVDAWKMGLWDWMICKDVLEHISYDNIDNTIHDLQYCSRNIFIVVPIADNEFYNERLYELDKTHIIRKDINWWIGLFKKHNIEIDCIDYHIPGIKSNWNNHPRSNGFFKLKTGK